MELTYQINSIIGSENIKQVRVGSLDASTSSSTFETNVPTVLEYLEFATDSEDKVRIFIEDKSVTPSVNIANGISLNGTSVLTSARPNNLISCGQWDVIAYNTTTNNYKFRFNLKGVIFPKGLKIYVENQDTNNAHNVGYVALVRKL